MFKKKTIEDYLKEILNNYSNQLNKDEITVIKDIIQNEELREYLNQDKRSLKLAKKLYSGLKKEELDELLLLCTGAWLEATTGLVIDYNGTLLVNIDENYKVSIDKKLNTKKFFVMQAILRHIERWVTMKHQNLLDPSKEVNRILEVGSGTLICSSMMRRIYPQATIIAQEPGLLSPKTLHLADINNINIIRSLKELEKDNKFDRILLHFVLEHCNDQEIRRLIRKSLEHLTPKGVISIVVPNFNAFHRDLEIALSSNDRNTITRLSLEDKLCGHKLIFNKEILEKIIKEEMRSLGSILPIQYQTVLPRPLSFKNLTKIKEYNVLATLQQKGHIKGMEDKGSVICILIGNSCEQILTEINTDGKTKEIFLELINKFALVQSQQKAKKFLKSYIF